MRIMGLDWGTVRIGAAMSDEEEKLAFPLQNPFNSKTAVNDIRGLVEEYSIEKIVIGLPVSLKGEDTASTDQARKFAEKLKKDLGVEVDYIDERFSSVESKQSLQTQEIKEKEQREIKDNITAALLLQRYLDTNNNNQN